MRRAPGRVMMSHGRQALDDERDEARGPRAGVRRPPWRCRRPGVTRNGSQLASRPNGTAGLTTRSAPALRALGLVAVAGSLIATTLTFHVLRRHETTRVSENFERRALERTLTLQRNIERQIDVLQSIVALHASSVEVTEDEFESFTAPLLRQHPEIEALQWVMVIPESSRSAYEQARREEGRPGFTMIDEADDGELVRASDRDEHHVVHLVEPDSHERALGFDFGSDPVRRAALEQARDTGRATVTPRLRLLADAVGNEEHGVIAIVPHYSGDDEPRTLEERRQRIEGFALGIFSADDLLRLALSPFDSARIRVFLFDDTTASDPTLVAAWPPRPGEPPGRDEIRDLAAGGLVHDRTFSLGDRRWRVVAAATPSFLRAQATWLPWLALGGGLLLSVLLAVYLLSLLRHSRRLEELATRDPLTGALNRRGLEIALTRALERRRVEKEPASALLVNFDDFKELNATFGYGVGDVVLVELSRRLAEGVGEHGAVGRIGGDEFLVVLPGAVAADALEMADRLRRRLSSAPVLAVPRAVTVTASIGVTEITDRSGSVIQVLARARAGLQRGKKQGKNAAALEAAHGDQPRQRRGEDLLEAILGGEGLRVHWEPIVELADGTVVGHELLVRGPAGDFEAPGEIFRLATESNLLTTVDVQCLRACAREAVAARRGGNLHLNLLPSTLLNVPVDSILRELAGVLEHYRVCIEINEQQFISHPTYLKDVVAALREGGLMVAVDDVGSGHGTLDSVFVLQPDVVKVDLSLVRGVASDPEKSLQLERLVRVCSSFSIEMIAEGVENARDRDLLRELGLRLGQGFLYPHAARTGTGA